MNGKRRSGNKPWKRIYGVDRKYTARVDRLKARQVWATLEADSEFVAGVEVGKADLAAGRRVEFKP
jgi:hypothetical protein